MKEHLERVAAKAEREVAVAFEEWAEAQKVADALRVRVDDLTVKAARARVRAAHMK